MPRNSVKIVREHLNINNLYFDPSTIKILNNKNR
jgi:hypothetical protein